MSFVDFTEGTDSYINNFDVRPSIEESIFMKNLEESQKSKIGKNQLYDTYVGPKSETKYVLEFYL